MIEALTILEKDIAGINNDRNEAGRFSSESVTSVERLRANDPHFPTINNLKALEAAVDGLIQEIMLWTAYQLHTHPLPAITRHWELFHLQQKVDFQNLIEKDYPSPNAPHFFQGPERKYRHRVGFELTDFRYDHTQTIGEVDQCIFCHNQNRDSCSKGVSDNQGCVKKKSVGYRIERLPTG